MIARTVETFRTRVSRHFRIRRMAWLASAFQLAPETTVLDVGGTLNNWRLLPFWPRLTIVNIIPPPEELPNGVAWMVADGRDLPFAEQSFDLCYSNSVIEHVGSWPDQVRLAQEIRRVGRSYYVQTPNYWFPVEPHFMAPFVHWLPKTLQALVVPYTPWGLAVHPSRRRVDERLRELRLVRPREMAVLFPDAQIHQERVLGLPKSLIAVRVDPRRTTRVVGRAR
jgi:hypothetical protein